MSTLRATVGRLLMVGLEGESLTPVEAAWLRLLRPSGVILFRRNIETVDQTRGLLDAAHKQAGEVVFRCVDVEGGLVDRLRDVIAPMPSAAAAASTGRRSLWRQHGLLIGREVRALGFNITLSPVLDLALPESASVMRTRSAAREPAEVAAYAEAFLEGLASAKAAGCGKHFPGLGGGTLDSHHAMPAIERSAEEMWQQDLLPYRQLAGKLPIVMVSHAAYPAASGETQPASVSRYWIGEVLRRKLRFRGLVLTDDMEMGGVLTQMPLEDAAIATVLAGTDLIEVCKDPALVMRTYEALLSEAERSPAFRRKVEQAARRIGAWSRRWPASPAPRSPVSQIDRLREQVRRFAATVAEAQSIP